MNISVIIPTYNRAHLLGRALISVINQTKQPDEILLIDDGSNDDTALVMESVAKNSAITITYLRQENKGPAAARNLGVRAAASELIAFLDSDDHWVKRKLEIQTSMMTEYPGFLISHTREKWYRRGNHLNQKKIHQPQGGDIFKNCLQLCCVGMSTVIARKEIFDQYGYFDEELPCCEDYDYWLRLSVFEEFLLVDKPLTIKEGGRKDQVSSIHRIGMDRYRIKAIDNLLKKNVLSSRQKALASDMLVKKCMIYGTGCLKHGKKEEGHRYLLLADLISNDNNRDENY